MSELPQELIDHIIDYVDDRKSLEACSLVSSQWSARSQKHLFVRVDFSSTRDLQRWCARIRPGPSGLSSFVEELSISEYHHSCTLPSPSWLHSSILSSAASHFRSFSALRVLEITRAIASAESADAHRQRRRGSFRNGKYIGVWAV